MAAGRMTQTQLVRHLAKRFAVNKKVARSFLDELAKVAVGETKKSGAFLVPRIGRRVKANRKARMGRLATGVAIRSRAQKAIPGKDPALRVLAKIFSHL